ncbi:hypothetical protein ACSBR2_005048 [Camellia fascicularis]
MSLSMEDSRIRISRLGFALVLIVAAVSAADNGGANAEAASRCNADLSKVIPETFGDTSKMVCKPVWNSYVIQYSQTKDNVVTIVVSAEYTSGWVGMAFSKDGMMLNASSMVGWISKEGQANVKQYYLKGFEQSAVVPDKGDLPLTKVPAFVALQGATIYIAFQLKFASLLARQPVLLAYGTKYPTKNHLLYPHDDKTSIMFDFSAVSASAASVPAPALDEISQAKHSHGILGLIGWGLFLPFGAIAARYFKHHDPLWYYLHVSIQFVGFILGVAAVILGASLYNRIHAHFPTHRGIGIFVLVLSILQVLAMVARPDKGSKVRKYWNWYHHWVGRIALFFGNLNIVSGMQIGKAGGEWKTGYIFLLSTVLATTIVLEVLARQKESHDSDILPAFQPNSHE